MKLRVVTALVAACVGAASYAAAATLGTTSKALQSGRVSVPACDSDGFTYTRTLDASHNVSTVTVSGINAACNTGKLTLTLTDSSNASLASGTATVGTTGNVTVTLTGTAPAANVKNYVVAIAS